MSASDTQPIVHAYTLGVADLVGGTLRALFNRPGLYFGLSLANLTALALPVAGVVALTAHFGSEATTVTRPDSPLLIILASVVAAVLAPAFVLKSSAVMSLALEQQSLGREPGVMRLLAGTRGLLRRSAPLLLALLALISAVGVLIAFVVRGSSTPGEALASMAMPQCVIGLVELFLLVRLYVLLPVLAIERRGPIQTIARAWRLTEGGFWVTLGRHILLILLAGVIGAGLGGGVGLVRVALGSGMGSMLTDLVLLGVLGAVAMMTIVPFQTVYTTLMYVDRRRRADGVTAVPRGTGVGIVSPFSVPGAYTAAFTPRPEAAG